MKNVTVIRFDSIGSTNSEAIEHAKRGAGEGLCIVAREQTAGRGRHGRKWVSKPDSGLYVSFLFRPIIEPEFLPLMTLMAGVAVCDALANSYGLRPDIKWSNDVLINEKKVSGVLTEAIETANGLAVIVGIGINLDSSAFGSEISKTATSIASEIGRKPDREELLTSLTNFLAYFYELLREENGTDVIRNEWEKRSTYSKGKQVRVTFENDEFVGITAGLEKDGGLRLRTENGETRVVRAGDVERLR